MVHGSTAGEQYYANDDNGATGDHRYGHALTEEESGSDDHEADCCTREDWICDRQTQMLERGGEAEEICGTERKAETELESPRGIMWPMSDGAEDRICRHIQNDCGSEKDVGHAG
jgi:hypothetical protein